MSRTMSYERHLAQLTAIASLAVSSCSDPLYLGTDLLWSARHESGELTEWTDDPQAFTSASDATAARIADGRAHTGRYAVSLTRPPSDLEGGPRLGHGAGLPSEAYYAAWLYIAEDYPIETYWAIIQFRSVGAPIAQGIDEKDAEIRIRRLPEGQLILYVFQHDGDYLQAPLADPPAVAPVGQWFQLELFYRHVDDPSGRIRVWLDGRLVYDLGDRRTGPGSPWFGLASISADSGSTALRIFADDVSISVSRATVHELLERP
jgi:hypothetical protein